VTGTEFRTSDCTLQSGLIRARFRYLIKYADRTMSKDLYKMLGITRSADQKAIRAACRAPAKEYHPEGRDGRDPELLRTLRGT